MRFLLMLCLFLTFGPYTAAAQGTVSSSAGEVIILPMQLNILPGTGDFLKHGLKEAEERQAKLVVILLDTPGGMLQTAQDMVKELFETTVPVVVYVSPSGGIAGSAGVFITTAGHIAAMAPGTSLGAAHPVMPTGENIPDDMRTKTENITAAMIKSVAEQRGRNAEWLEKTVKESASLTAHEAVEKKVVDLMVPDLDQLLKELKGRKVTVAGKVVELGDYSALPRIELHLNLKQELFNVLANPMVAGLLWLGATAGLSIELYNPGAILPGVVGVICLVLALLVYQVIPINIGGILLLVIGAILIGLEMALPSGILGISGIVAMILGAIYLVDLSSEPALAVNMNYLIGTAALLGALMLAIVLMAVRSKRRPAITGNEGLVGKTGEALENVGSKGRVFVEGEIWKACTNSGIIEKGAPVTVLGVKDGLVLEVAPLK